MSQKYLYKTKGTCSQLIEITLDGDTVENLSFTGGCNGNLQGIGALTKGMKVDDVIERLNGLKCGFKDTSCPDQLSKALISIKEGKLTPA